MDELETGKVLDINIDDLFKEDEVDTEAYDNEVSDEQEKKEPEITTEAVSKRINEVRRKTEASTRDAMAKEMGYENYADMQKAKEREMLDEAGVDSSDIEEVVERLVKTRLENDPRLKKLEEYERSEKANFVTNQLKEINSISGNNYKNIDQLPKDVLSVWEKTGNLKQAYLAVEGENLITKNRSTGANGTLNHLANPGRASSSKVRSLTDEEKDIYRSVFPEMTDEELNKKTIEIE